VNGRANARRAPVASHGVAGGLQKPIALFCSRSGHLLHGGQQCGVHRLSDIVQVPSLDGREGSLAEPIADVRTHLLDDLIGHAARRQVVDVHGVRVTVWVDVAVRP
jgi:hypothetical protein